jgi:TatD DNase family protein
MFIDSHCHLDFPDLTGDLPAILANMDDQQVSAAVVVGVDLENWPRVHQLALAHPQLYATVGVHPEYTDCAEPTVKQLVELAQQPKVIAIGETGLDYYWQKDQPEWQRERFRVHIRAAKAAGRPLVVHTRDSAADTLRLLKEEGAEQCGGVMHCFTENWEIAQQALDLGFYISLSGIVTFKSATIVKDVAQRVPLDRLLIETDAPYLAPVPYRGKRNQPGYVRHVAEEIARLRELSLEEVGQATTANFHRLFPLTQVGGAA